MSCRTAPRKFGIRNAGTVGGDRLVSAAGDGGDSFRQRLRRCHLPQRGRLGDVGDLRKPPSPREVARRSRDGGSPFSIVRLRRTHHSPSALGEHHCPAGATSRPLCGYITRHKHTSLPRRGTIANPRGVPAGIADFPPSAPRLGETFPSVRLASVQERGLVEPSLVSYII